MRILLGSLVALVVLCTLASATPTLSFGAWNVQAFGTSKAGKPEVMRVVAETFRQWDIGLIMEVRDNSHTAVKDLHRAINDYSGPQYDLTISPRLGNSVSKEQYGFFYKRGLVKVVDSYLSNDKGNKFSREPYNVLFEVQGGQRFFAVPIHTVPEDSVREIDALVPVFEDAVRRFRTDKGVIIGDMNADCTYVSDKEKAGLRLRREPGWTWLIPDGVDTTVSNTHCTYDRIIVNRAMLGISVPNSARVVNFQRDNRLSQMEALRISDHHAVAFDIQVPGANVGPRPNPPQGGFAPNEPKVKPHEPFRPRNRDNRPGPKRPGDNRPGNRPGNRPDNRPGNRPGDRLPKRPNGRPDVKPSERFPRRNPIPNPNTWVRDVGEQVLADRPVEKAIFNTVHDVVVARQRAREEACARNGDPGCRRQEQQERAQKLERLRLAEIAACNNSGGFFSCRAARLAYYLEQKKQQFSP